MKPEHEALIESYADRLPPLVLDEVRNLLPGTISKEKVKQVLQDVEALYRNANIHPGECVGLVSAQSIGEPGTQMSLDYAEKVIVKSRNSVSAVKIGEFIDRIFEDRMFKNGASGDAEIRRFRDSEVANVEELGIFVPALSQRERIEWKKVTAISRHLSPAALLKIKTRSGRHITATPYHSFVVRKDNKVIPVAGSTLNVGDRIPSVKNIVNLTCNQYLNLRELLPPTRYLYESELRKAMNKEQEYAIPIKSYEQINNYVQGRSAVQLQQQCVYTYQRHGMAALPELLPLDGQSGFLIGAYLAEGTHTKHYVSIANTAPEYLQHITSFAEKHNIHYKIRHELGEYGQSTSLLLYSTLLADLLHELCGRGAHHKFVPVAAYAAHPSFVRGLLQAYFDGDGNINVARKVIRASSSSKELRDGITLLLAQFGIFALKGTNKGQYTLAISHRYAGLFLNKIGLTIPRKRRALEELAALPERAVSYDLIDMIPGIGETLFLAGKRAGIPSRLTAKFTRKQKIGRQALRKYIRILEQAAEKKSLKEKKSLHIEKELKELSRAANSDVIWDEISSLRYVAPSHNYVYDFSVEDLETFTTFDGIVTHNTLNTFHFAGVAEMNVTTGLPRIIEIFDATKEIKTPMMEIHLKKGERMEEVRKFAATIKETLLKDVIEEYVLDIFEQSLMLRLNQALIDDFDLRMEDIAQSIREKVLRGKMHKIFQVRVQGASLLLTPKDTQTEKIKELYGLKEKLQELQIKGLKGIKQVLPVRRDDVYIILTSGTNLKEILQLKDVDTVRTISNDIHEIYKVLGIEAARQAIIDEVYRVIEAQGLNINLRHVMLVADIMCAGGVIKGITRYGVVSEKSSVLARASFETPIKHLINAALEGEVDLLASVVENVMVNQPVPLGTGLPGLVTKMK